jgi:hypothetical protein
MADDQLIVAAKRLGTDLRDLKSLLRKSYRNPTRQVISSDIRETASTLAETWIRDFAQRQEIACCVAAKYLADLNVHFQRILVFTEKATVRSKYDQEIGFILKDYTASFVVPLMQDGARIAPDADAADAAVKPTAVGQIDAEGFRPTAFIGHSFAVKDVLLVEMVTATLGAIGVKVVTGHKPRADRISAKVKDLIDGQHMFVGIFTRGDRLVGKKEWSTSAWVIDEKAYASASKKLILLKEAGVESIGGIQGDYEYIEFDRNKFDLAILSLLQLFKLSASGLH